MNNIKKILILIIIVMAVVTIYFSGTSKTTNLSASGIIETTKINVSSKTYGQITKLKVKEGDSVKKDEVIAILDRQDISAQRQSQEALVKVSQANLQDLKNGLRPEEIDDIKWQLTQAESNMNKTSNDLLR